MLEDNEVANILDNEIDSLQLEPTKLNLPVGKRDFTVFRIDFKATITLENNENQALPTYPNKEELKNKKSYPNGQLFYQHRATNSTIQKHCRLTTSK